MLKAFSLANVSILLTLPILVWGADISQDTRTVHYLLVFGYSFIVFLHVFTGQYTNIVYLRWSRSLFISLVSQIATLVVNNMLFTGQQYPKSVPALTTIDLSGQRSIVQNYASKERL